jgi:hypothetical protein
MHASSVTTAIGLAIIALDRRVHCWTMQGIMQLDLPLAETLSLGCDPGVLETGDDSSAR